MTISALKVGDIITQFPIYQEAEDFFDISRADRIQAYEIATINIDRDVLGLVVVSQSIPVCASPGEIGRLFIKRSDLIISGKWWT